MLKVKRSSEQYFSINYYKNKLTDIKSCRVRNCCLTPSDPFSALWWREQVAFRWHDDDVYCIPDQHRYYSSIFFYCWIFIVSSPIQQSTDRRKAVLLTHLSDYVSTSLCSYSIILCLAAANTNFILLVWPMTYHNASHCTTDVVKSCREKCGLGWANQQMLDSGYKVYTCTLIGT